MHASVDIAENSGKATVTIHNKQTQEKAKGKVVYFSNQCVSVVNSASDTAKRHK